MRRIISPVAILLLFVMTLQMGCMTTKISQLDNSRNYLHTLKEGQRVRVHYVDKNENPLEGVVKKVSMEAVVITYRLSDRIPRDLEIPYEQIHRVEQVNKELSVGRTVLATGGVIGLLAVVVFIAALSSYNSFP